MSCTWKLPEWMLWIWTCFHWCSTCFSLLFFLLVLSEDLRRTLELELAPLSGVFNVLISTAHIQADWKAAITVLLLKVLSYFHQVLEKLSIHKQLNNYLNAQNILFGVLPDYSSYFERFNNIITACHIIFIVLAIWYLI